MTADVALALEIQELRQFCIGLISAIPDHIMQQDIKDYWWEKLGSYPKVEA